MVVVEKTAGVSEVGAKKWPGIPGRWRGQALLPNWPTTFQVPPTEFNSLDLDRFT